MFSREHVKGGERGCGFQEVSVNISEFEIATQIKKKSGVFLSDNSY